ncbi:MAG: RNA methyltransferase, partial [Bdellovibrionia bacterium]
MKLHRHLAQSVVTSLQEIFDPEQGRYADRVIEFHMKNNRKWGARDRRFFAEGVYDIVRWWRLMWGATGEKESLDERSLWKVVAAWLVFENVEVPNWIEFEDFDHKRAAEFFAQKDLPRAVAQSIPDWLDEVGSRELGPRWNKILPALNVQADVVLRANRLKTTPKDLRNKLETESISAKLREGFDDAVILNERKNVWRTESFKAGLFEVQELASQKVAVALGPKPGERVIDACAGAGGKTLHIAALMGN